MSVRRMADGRMPRGVVTFNAGITACGTAACWTWAWRLFQEMAELEIEANIISYNATLKDDGSWRASIDRIRRLIDEGLQLQMLTQNMGSSACVKSGGWQRGLSLLLFQHGLRRDAASYLSHRHASWCQAVEMLRRNLDSAVDWNLVTLNGVLGACSWQQQWQAALLLVGTLDLSSLLMDVISQSSVGSATSRHNWTSSMAFLTHCQAENLQQDIVVLNSHLSELSWPRAFHLLVENRGLRPTRLTWNALAGSRWQRALLAGEDGFRPDTVTWTTMLSRGAWQVSLKELRMTQLKVASVTCSALITSCDQRWEEALEWLQLHETLGLQGDLLVHNGVLVACERSQRWERAVQILLANVTGTGGHRVDAIGCTTCLTACGRASAWQAALCLLAEMRCILVRAHLISHNACLSACEEAGQWRHGLHLLDEMCCTSLGPDSLSCNTAISACEKAKRWRHALGLFHRKSRQPNTLTFNTTSSACSKGRQWRWSAYLISKLPQAARGAFVMTLLSGKALECVEHMEMSEYQCEGGDLAIWKLLDARFPSKDKTDELGELLTEVFQLRVIEGETVKTWVARTTELFDRLSRKTQVTFPEEARGWLILHRAGLTDEQKAVILARAQGSLKREDISRSMRSCFPEMTLSRKRTTGAALVEESEALSVEHAEDEIEFTDVDSLLAEHLPEGSDEVFSEKDVAEILAVSWREKRQELAKLQRARKFDKATESRKAFRVEIEELKKRTRCHRCGKPGHWSKECRMPRTASKKDGADTKPASTSGAALVQSEPADQPEVHFVASVQSLNSLCDQVQQLVDERRRLAAISACDVPVSACEPPVLTSEVLLVSSPGYGVLDSGCGKTIIGEETLAGFLQLWHDQGIALPSRDVEENHFRFGNGQSEVSQHTIKLPVHIAGRAGLIKAAIVKGGAPLLISRAALQTLKASINFGDNTLTIFDEQLCVPLQVNAAGQYVLNLMKSGGRLHKGDVEVMTASPDSVPSSSSSNCELSEPVDDETVSNQHDTSASPSEPPLAVWTQEDWGCQSIPKIANDGPRMQFVRKCVVKNGETGKVIVSVVGLPGKNHKSLHQPLPSGVTHVMTEWYHVDPKVLARDASSLSSEHPDSSAKVLSAHQIRQVHSQIKGCALLQHDQTSAVKSSRLVVEVFSPPRFAIEAEKRGFAATSVDLTLGCDLSIAANRAKLKQDLRDNPPELLVLCPPCTHEGGWFNLNATRMEQWLYLKIRARSRTFIRFCMELFQQQVSLGKRAVFEHPTGARTWTYPEVQRLCRRFFTAKLHMCQYGLKLPDSQRHIRKSTRLLVSHEDMTSLAKTCDHTSGHESHDVVAGSNAQVGQVSTFAGKYPVAFVRAVLETVPAYHQHEVLEVVEDQLPDSGWEVLASGVQEIQQSEEKDLLPVLTKLHRNLGHPPNQDMVRLLKHGLASEKAIELARSFKCSFCEAHAKPKVPLPAQTTRVTEFNRQIGVDVKHLRGWLPNQKIKALNIVDQASCFQRMIPFFERETSPLLRQLLDQHWIAWTGQPSEIVLDPAQTNLADPMFVPAEDQGVNMKVIAAEAHWQLGRTENHGGWFDRILSRIIDEHSPRNKCEWLECVQHAHIKNQLIQSYGYTPHQFVFGKNPHIPSDLLNEPAQVVPLTASLSDTAIERSQAIRTTARKAVMELQDNKALRLALLARPRVAPCFQPGDIVAYWRAQKWINGVLHQDGKWYGSAIVLGKVGRNLILIHRKQIFRCAPEQVRAATQEERALVQTPHAELLGVKDLIEGGAFKSSQYVDLVSQAYPPQEDPIAPDAPVDPHADADVSMPPAVEPTSPPETGAVPESAESPASVEPAQDNSEAIDKSAMEDVPDLGNSGDSSSTYGPIRRRIKGKDGPNALYRPPSMRQEDFVEIMREIIPDMINSFPHGTKRPLETGSTETATEDASSSQTEPSACRPRHDTTEVLSVEHFTDVDNWHSNHLDFEVLMAEYLRKKMEKELPHSRNSPALQRMVDEGKRTEWKTMTDKPDNVRVHYGKKAQEIKQKFSHRFIGSRFVLTRKPIEEGRHIDTSDLSTFTVKGRWCLQGHLDPDLDIKAQEGKLKSPTLSQLGRTALMQTISSKRWLLQLGDVKGAFLEAGPLEDRFRPLYAHQPPGGIPGVPEDAVIEVCGNVYGQNDAPAAWHKTFDEALREEKWQPSCFDPCLYTLRNEQNELIGILGIHVDDCALGGHGPQFEASVAALRRRFTFRKWRTSCGEFCGAMYSQEKDGTIHMSMQSFTDKLKPASISKGASSEAALTDQQVRVLRAINGSLNWLSSQSRPDLAAQTSFSQQSFPNPKIRHLRNANNIIRRARQHRDLGLSFKPIDLDSLMIVCHSDAAFANRGDHTQAGFMISFSQKGLNDGQVATWNPAAWRSYRLSRAVSSTLSAESQAMSTASGTVEWLALMMHEIQHGPFDLRDARSLLKQHQPMLITDCKSLYDHLHSPSSPTAIEDRRTSIDICIIKESVKAMQAHVRWVPTNRMIADSLTKDQGDPIDLLRSCLRSSTYQVSPEQYVLENQAMEKQRRVLRKLMKRAKHDGSLAQILNEPGCSDWTDFPVAMSGSMTDGSKRRLFSPSEIDDDEFDGEHVIIPKTATSAQLPLPRAGPPVTIPIDLPDHVESMEMWGATIIDFGKYKDQDMSYAELYASRETDQRVDAYVKWVMSHGEKSTGHLRDLFKYLSALMKSHGVNESLQPSQISFNALASGLSDWQRVVQLLDSGNPEITLCEEAAIRCEAAGEAAPLLHILELTAQSAAVAKTLRRAVAVGTDLPSVLGLNPEIFTCFRDSFRVSAVSWSGATKPRAMPIEDCCKEVTLCAKLLQWHQGLRLLQDAEDAALEMDVIACSSGIHLCERANLWPSALQWLRNLQRCQLQANIICYNSAIRAHQTGQDGQAHPWTEALQLQDLLRSRALLPDIITYSAAAVAMKTQNSHWSWGFHLLSRLSMALLRADIIMQNTVISAMGADQWWLATSLLERLLYNCTLITYNSVLNACEKSGQWNRALRVFTQALEHFKVDAFSYSAAVSACEKGLAWTRALHLEQSMAPVPQNLLCYNGTLSACEKSSHWEFALHSFLQRINRPLKVDGFTLNALLGALARGSQWRWALQLLQQGQRLRWSNLISYNTAMLACVESEQWTHLLQLLDELPIAADLVTMNTMASVSYGHWKRQLQVLSSHKFSSLEPDILTTNLQLSAAHGLGWHHALQCFLTQRDRNIITYNASLKALGSASWLRSLWILQSLAENALHGDVLTLEACLASCEAQFVQEAKLLNIVSQTSLGLKLWKEITGWARFSSLKDSSRRLSFRFHHSAARCVSALAGQWSESERAFKSDQAALGYDVTPVYPSSMVLQLAGGKDGATIRSLAETTGVHYLKLNAGTLTGYLKKKMPRDNQRVFFSGKATGQQLNQLHQNLEDLLAEVHQKMSQEIERSRPVELLVKGLPADMGPPELEELVAEFGVIESIEPWDRQCLVTFAMADEAENAMRGLSIGANARGECFECQLTGGGPKSLPSAEPPQDAATLLVTNLPAILSFSNFSLTVVPLPLSLPFYLGSSAMSSAMEKLVAVMPELQSVQCADGLAEEVGEQIKNQLKEMSWKCAEEAAAVQTQLATQKQQKEQAELELEKAKTAEREICVELEKKVNTLLKAQEELTSVQREQQILTDASRDEMLVGKELREFKEANRLITEEVFPCLLNGAWTSEEEKVEKLQGLKDYLKSIGTELTLVAAVDGFGTCPEQRGDFDKMAIQCIDEELTQKRQQLEEQLLSRQPAEKRREAELAGIQALLEICAQNQSRAEAEHSQVDVQVKEKVLSIRGHKRKLGTAAKALEQCMEQLKSHESEVAKIQEAVAAVDELVEKAKSERQAATMEATVEAAPSTPKKFVATEVPSEPPVKRARTEDGNESKEHRRESQVASPARIRC
eukprot:s1174_g6.t1